MPGLSGLEAAGHIVRQVDCKVLFLTNLAGDDDFTEVLSGMVRDGIHCAALPANVSIADLIKFVRAGLGPVIILTDAGTDEPRGIRPRPLDRLPVPTIVQQNRLMLNRQLCSTPPAIPNPCTSALCHRQFQPLSNERLSPRRSPGYGHGPRDQARLSGIQLIQGTRALMVAGIVHFGRHPLIPAMTNVKPRSRKLATLSSDYYKSSSGSGGDGDADDEFAAVQATEQDRPVKEWRRRSGVSDPNGIASHNLAVFNHLMALQTEGPVTFGRPVVAPDFWKDAFNYWHAVVENSRFWDCFIQRIRHVNDPRVTPDLAEKIWASLPRSHSYINAANAVRAAEAGDFVEAAPTTADVRRRTRQAECRTKR